MKPLHIALLAALGVQVLLAVFTWWPSSTAAVAKRPLIDGVLADITSLEVTRMPDKEGKVEAVKLEKTGDKWVVTSAGGYPARADKVVEVLENLLEVKIGAPIATQKVNHAALKVSEEDYGRKVKVTAKGQTLDFVLGAGGGNTANLRFEGQDEVFNVKDLTEWSVRERGSNYWEAEYISLDKEVITSLTVENPNGTLALHREGSDWVLDSAPAGSEIDRDKVTRLVDKLVKVRMKDPVGETVKPEYGLDAPGTKVTWSTEEDGQSTNQSYRLGAEVDGAVYLKSDDSTFVVTLATYAAKNIREAKVGDLLVALQAPAMEP